MVLYLQNYTARALPILFNTPKKSLLKSTYPKKYLPNFRIQKYPGIENFKPKKSFDHPEYPPRDDDPLLLKFADISVLRLYKEEEKP